MSALVNGKCRAGHYVQATALDVRAGWITCPCGASAVARFMTVTRKPAGRCGVRCTSSLGPVCVCTCDGRNHGSDHTYTTTQESELQS